MTGIVLTFPIKSGKVEAWRRFCQEISGSRLQSYEVSRRRLGITGERMALVTSAYGAETVTTIEADDLGQALGGIITSDLLFDCWYREQIQALHGIQLAGYQEFAHQITPPPNQELLFEWAVSSDRQN